jgi:hypothetical protein
MPYEYWPNDDEDEDEDEDNDDYILLDRNYTNKERYKIT